MDQAPGKNGEAENPDGETAVYLFAFARTELLPELAGPGLDGRRGLVGLSWQDISAVACQVSRRDFSGPEGEGKMQDLVWLEPRVCRHQELIGEVMRYSPVLPARFGTLFSSRRTLKSLMKRHYRLIAGFLDRVADMEEWAVKGWLDTEASRGRLLAETLAGHAGKLASLLPGRRYFYEQRLRGGLDRELRIQVEKIARDLAAHLRPAAAEFRERRLHRSPSGKTGDLVLNWAFLVPRRALADFQARLQEAAAVQADAGLILEHSGPWPPYSFSPPLH
jgi:hypothetical protein